MKQFWLITYRYIAQGRTYGEYEMAVTDEHPLDFIQGLRNMAEFHSFSIHFALEITEEYYKKYKSSIP